MKLARFSLNDSPCYVFMRKDRADGEGYFIKLGGHPLADNQVRPTGTHYPVDDDGIRLLSLVVPSKVYGLAENHKTHAQFMYGANYSEVTHTSEDMVIFTKPFISVIGPDDPIVYPACSKDMNFEPEVTMVISHIAKNVTVENVMGYVLGSTYVNDMTLHNLQGIDPTWTHAEGFDTSCPLSPWIVIRDDLDWKDTKISLALGGEDMPVASDTIANLIHGIPEQIIATSSFSTLLPGDVIVTDTPSASGHLDPGGETIVHVEGIGSLHDVTVRA